MATYVAMLRGINIGSRIRLSMADLRQVVEAAAGQRVRTYVQSGNVVFSIANRDPASVATIIEKGIGAAGGPSVAVIVRSAAEMAAIAARRPFPAADPAHLHVTFLAGTPDAKLVSALDAAAFEPDQFTVAGQEVYLYCPNGYGRSRLSNDFFEKKLGVRATTRNWRSVTALAELAGSVADR
jgi:uncharacterized protein (DUF1697 family)